MKFGIILEKTSEQNTYSNKQKEAENCLFICICNIILTKKNICNVQFRIILVSFIK